MVGVIAAAACSGEPGAPIRLEVPVGAEHRAVLIAAETHGVLSVRAQAVVGGAIEPVIGPLGDDTRVTVLLYRESLAELGIVPGEVAKEEGGRALPAADVTLESQPGLSGTWSEVQEIGATLSAFRIAKGASPCAERVPTTIALAGAPARFTLAIPDRGLLIGGEGGSMTWLDPARTATVIPVAGRFYDAILEPDGAITFAADGGRLMRGTPAPPVLSLVQTATLASISDVLYIDGDPAVELFGQQRDGTVFRYDGTKPEAIAQVGGRGRPTGIVRIAPGVAISAWGDCLCVLRHRGGETEEIAVPANSLTSNGVSALLYDPALGLVAGSFIGEILEATVDVESWMKIEGTYATIEVASIAKFHSGYVYADERSVVVERVPGFGYCDPLPPVRPTEALGQVAVFGEEIVVASDVVTWWSARR